MDFVAVVDQVIALLRQRGRVAYRTLKRQFQLDDEALEDLKIELIDSQRLATDEQGTVLVWSGAGAEPPAAPADSAGTVGTPPPLAYTPPYLAEKILTSRTALEGERKLVTVLFADLKGSMELLADRDPEEARQLLDPVLERMMDAPLQPRSALCISPPQPSAGGPSPGVRLAARPRGPAASSGGARRRCANAVQPGERQGAEATRAVEKAV